MKLFTKYQISLRWRELWSLKKIHLTYLLIIMGQALWTYATPLLIDHVENYLTVLNAHAETEYIIIEKTATLTPEVIYKYNDQVPVEVVKAEIVKQAEAFKVNPAAALALADCESQFDNLAINHKDSIRNTSTGVFQFTTRTWNATGSWQVYRRARTDYKANIFEAMIKLSNKEYSHWSECNAWRLFN